LSISLIVVGTYHYIYQKTACELEVLTNNTWDGFDSKDNDYLSKPNSIEGYKIFNISYWPLLSHLVEGEFSQRQVF